MATNSNNDQLYQVLLVGCGQLGSRHLQALASMPQIGLIEVLDPRPEAELLGQERLAQIPDRSPTTEIQWHTSLEDAARNGDLCIVATLADVRCEMVNRISAGLGYSSFLLEKLAADSVDDYQDLLDLTTDRFLSVWVNCKSRAYLAQKRVKQHLDPSEPFVFTATGGNHGLANNGIHSADLFCFYDGTDTLEASDHQIDSILHTSKRGNSVFDLSGTMHGYSSKGSEFFLSFAKNNAAPVQIAVSSPRYRSFIDDESYFFYESRIENGWRWEQAAYDDNIFVSHMTRRFASDILGTGKCELPTLQECFPAHRFILSELLPHFNRLMGVEGNRCPVN